MKYTLLLVAFITSFIATPAHANTKLALTKIDRIYWLIGSEQQNAIAYGQFENFHNLMSLIEQTTITNNLVKSSECTGVSKADQLLLIGKKVGDYISLMSDCIAHGDNFYKSDADLINKYKTINLRRFNNGESISKRALKIAKQKAKV